MAGVAESTEIGYRRAFDAYAVSSLDSHPFKIRYGRNSDLLDDFYLPVFERALRYDAVVGLASSTTLAAAAAGLQRLIARGGSARLICGAGLRRKDASAIGKGQDLDGVLGEALLRELAPCADTTVQGRLEALAWMLSHQHLELRVALPRDAAGIPLIKREARACFEPTEAVVRDAEGHQLAWSGQRDTFWTFTSFPRGHAKSRIAEAASHVQAVAHRFEALWEGREPSWSVHELPARVRDHLLGFCPTEAPSRDPLEKVVAAKQPALGLSGVTGPVDERLLFRFLREAPKFPGGRDLGVATSAVEPWPHQLRLVRRVVERFPRGFLFCDEVGLGKTVEAGLALRQLYVSRRVKRALILVPGNVVRQWQEELWEKAALSVPRFEGGKLYDVFGLEVGPRKKRQRSKNPWNVAPLVLASSHLARRRERRAELLSADPWDLVIVDEAHHARRKDFRPGRSRPNTLLELLAGRGGRRGLKDRTRCLYLLTATPMQVHPVEVWDLLKLLGLGGRWGAFEEHFLRYFEELRLPYRERDWTFLREMLAESLADGPGLDPSFRRSAAERLGAEAWSVIESLPRAGDPARSAASLDPAARQVLDELLRRHTPLAAYVERNTRKLLRRYRMQGLLRAHVPERRPENVWIPFRDDERALYERIEDYLTDYYRRFEAQRRGLGFIMTVYRRRLTSSFYAIRRSLERRLAYLRGEAGSESPAGLFAEDFEQEALERDLFEAAEESSDSEQIRSEQAYLEDFLRELGALGRDSKVERLFADLETLAKERDTIIVFTQYADTMDHLREELRPLYGERLACYSGRGGERWDGRAWRPRRKEEVKESFRLGEVRLLLCTESASEGLNLQTCGVLINFDMPWNPMRVEQRIGRLDRIGQAFPEVWIRNYFYADSVEAVIYRRLSYRIRWFEQVLGRLQPILHRLGEVIEDVAMAGGKRRQRRLEQHLAALSIELDQGSTENVAPLDPEEELPEAEGKSEPSAELETPITLADLETLLPASETCGGRFAAHPEIERAYLLSWNDRQTCVTFSSEIFDRYPNSVQLLTWGHPLFEEILAAAEAPPESEEPHGLGLYFSRTPEPVSLFLHPTRGAMTGVTRLEDLRHAVAAPAGAWVGSSEGEAVASFSQVRRDRLQALRQAEDAQRRGEERALAEAARQVLRRAALVTLALGRHAGLFGETLPYGFTYEAVAALRQRGGPFAALLELVGGEEIEIRSRGSLLPHDPGQERRGASEEEQSAHDRRQGSRGPSRHPQRRSAADRGRAGRCLRADLVSPGRCGRRLGSAK